MIHRQHTTLATSGLETAASLRTCIRIVLTAGVLSLFAPQSHADVHSGSVFEWGHWQYNPAPAAGGRTPILRRPALPQQAKVTLRTNSISSLSPQNGQGTGRGAAQGTPINKTPAPAPKPVPAPVTPPPTVPPVSTPQPAPAPVTPPPPQPPVTVTPPAPPATPPTPPTPTITVTAPTEVAPPPPPVTTAPVTPPPSPTVSSANNTTIQGTGGINLGF